MPNSPNYLLGQRSELNLVAVAQSDNHVAPETQPPPNRLHILDLLVRRVKRLGCTDVHDITPLPFIKLAGHLLWTCAQILRDAGQELPCTDVNCLLSLHDTQLITNMRHCKAQWVVILSVQTE